MEELPSNTTRECNIVERKRQILEGGIDAWTCAAICFTSLGTYGCVFFLQPGLPLGFLLLLIINALMYSGLVVPPKPAGVPPVVETGSRKSWTSVPQPIDSSENCLISFGLIPPDCFEDRLRLLPNMRLAILIVR